MGLHIKLHYKCEKDPATLVKIACDLEQTFVDNKAESSVNTVGIDEPDMPVLKSEKVNTTMSTTSHPDMSESCLGTLEDRIVNKVIAALNVSSFQETQRKSGCDNRRDGSEKGGFKGRGCFTCEGPILEENVLLKNLARDAGRRATKQEIVPPANQFHAL